MAYLRNRDAASTAPGASSGSGAPFLVTFGGDLAGKLFECRMPPPGESERQLPVSEYLVGLGPAATQKEAPAPPRVTSLKYSASNQFLLTGCDDGSITLRQAGVAKAQAVAAAAPAPAPEPVAVVAAEASEGKEGEAAEATEGEGKEGEAAATAASAAAAPKPVGLPAPSVSGQPLETCFLRLVSHDADAGGVSGVSLSYDHNFVLSAGLDGHVVVHRVKVDTAPQDKHRMTAQDIAGVFCSSPLNQELLLKRCCCCCA